MFKLKYIVLIAVFYSAVVAHAQELVNDTLCIVPGQSWSLNVTFNDPACQGPTGCIVQAQGDKCFRITEIGEVILIGKIEDCCGDHLLSYRLANNPQELATVLIQVKCPKPDCGYVELDMSTSDSGTGGGSPQDPPCLNACSNSVATYFVPHVAGNVYNWSVIGGSYTVVSPGEIDVTWNNPGSGTIILTITNGSSTVSKTFCVDIVQSPIAAFTTAMACACLNSPISFINNSQFGNTYFWDFGDGNTSTMVDPTHTYGIPGTYNVTLTVTNTIYGQNGNGLCCCTDTAQMQVVIEDKEGPNIYWISTLCEGDSSKYWTDATGCNFTWNVTDANNNPVSFSGQGNDTICVAWGSGPYGNVTLQLSGCSNSTYCTKPVTVVVPIISSVTLINGPLTVCQNESATYDVPKWMSVDYDWSIMGGTISSIDTNSHTISVVWGSGPIGMLTVHYKSKFLANLPIHDGEDCTGWGKITVNIKPKFKLNPTPANECLGATTSISAMPLSPPGGYNWFISPNFSPYPLIAGAGTINVTWPAAGTYTISIVPTNPNIFCNDTIKRIITVIDVPAPDSISGPNLICPGDTYQYMAHSTATNTSFVWSIVGGNITSYTGNPVTVTWNNTGPYSLTVNQISLGSPSCSSSSITYNVYPKTIQGPLSIVGGGACQDKIQTYSINPLQDPSATYNWTIVPAAAGSVVMGQGTGNISVQWNNGYTGATLSCTITLCGSMQTVIRNISIIPPILPNIVTSGYICTGGNGMLTVPTPGIVSYLWSNGGTGSSIAVNMAGTYTVMTTDINGCMANDVITVALSPLPIAQISTPDVTGLCINPNPSGQVTMYAMTNPSYSYQWYLGGSPITSPAPPNATSTSPTYVHNNTGVIQNFAYQIKVTDNVTGCMKLSNFIIVHQDSCLTDTTCIPDAASAYAIVGNPDCSNGTFSVSGNVISVLGWGFGDASGNGYTGSISNPTHDYATAGCRPVYADVVVPNLKMPPIPAVCTTRIYTSICVPLAANFNYTNNCAAFTFNGCLSTVLTPNTINTYSWDFGAGFTSPSASCTASYTFPTNGTYPVTLVITGSGGCTDTITKYINVLSAPNANFNCNSYVVCEGDDIKYTPLSTAGILTFAWNFGDLSTNGSNCPLHAYVAGSYTTTLTVTDINGCTSSATQNILVHPNPSPGVISVSPSAQICLGDSVTLTAAPGFSYLWNTGATTQAIVVYASGTYGVVLTDANMCMAVPDSVQIIVHPAPLATISGSHFICGTGCITLNATPGLGLTYQWLDSGLSPISGETNGSIQVCDFNLYGGSVSVMITDANGCSAISLPWTVNLVAPPTVGIAVVSGDTCAGGPNILSATPILAGVNYSWNDGSIGTGITVYQAGTYTVFAKDVATGCISSASITIHPLPDLCFVPVGCYKVCIPDTLCGPSGLAAYQWNMNGLPIAGATMQTFVVTQPGSYSLTGTNQFGCSLTSDSLILETMVCCDTSDTQIIVESGDPDECCLFLTYSNQIDSIYGMTINVLTPGVTMSGSMVGSPLMISGSSPTGISLIHVTAGQPIPMGTFSNFIKLCVNDVDTNEMVFVVNWYDFQRNVLCTDTFRFECKEKSCVIVKEDSIYCNGQGQTFYQTTICNPSTSTHNIAFINLHTIAPALAIVNPATIDLTGSPLLPGQCTTLVFSILGGNFANQNLCFTLMVHDANPNTVDSTWCCTTDTICKFIPGCTDCEKVYVSNVSKDQKLKDSCCYAITIGNYFSPTAFQSISLNVITPGSNVTFNNPITGNWLTTGLSSTSGSFTWIGPGGYIPLGNVAIPSICISSSQYTTTQIEISWIGPGNVVCKDTFDLYCSDCGNLAYEIKCDEQGNWLLVGTVYNNTIYTISSLNITFSNPGLSVYNQTIPVGPIAPNTSWSTLVIPIGAPGVAGQSISALITLHSKEKENCCSFRTEFVLPDCSVDKPCLCDEHFQQQSSLGVSVTNIGNTYTFTLNGSFDPDCDKVIWEFGDGQTTTSTAAILSMNHTYAINKKYTFCVYVIRNTGNQECKIKMTKDIKVKGSVVALSYPNPNHGVFTLDLSGYDDTGNIKIEVFDASGILIKNNKVDFRNDKAIVDITNKENGLYIVRITSNGFYNLLKVIKIE